MRKLHGDTRKYIVLVKSAEDDCWFRVGCAYNTRKEAEAYGKNWFEWFGEGTACTSWYIEECD